MTPQLARLLADPSRVAEMPAEEIPALLGQLERLRAELWRRMISATASENGRSGIPAEGLPLSLAEAARMLRTSPDTLYRKWRKLPFAYKDPIDGRVKFSLAGIDKYLRQHHKKD